MAENETPNETPNANEERSLGQQPMEALGQD